MAFFNPSRDVAGYREAVDAETRGRDVAWLGLNERINGVEVLPFTPRHFLILSLIGSPFICGGAPSPEEAARFLWAVSPGFTEGNLARARWRRWRFVAGLRRLKWSDTVKGIETYVDAAFADSIGGDGSKRSYFSCMAGLVDVLAAEYGWDEQTVLSTPFRKLFQLFRSRQQRHDPEARLTNPSQRLISKHLESLNQQRN